MDYFSFEKKKNVSFIIEMFVFLANPESSKSVT